MQRSGTVREGKQAQAEELKNYKNYRSVPAVRGQCFAAGPFLCRPKEPSVAIEKISLLRGCIRIPVNPNAEFCQPQIESSESSERIRKVLSI